MAKYSKEQREQSLATLREHLKPGQTVYTVLRHVSSSGMSRSISLVTVDGNDLREWDYAVAQVLDASLDAKHGGVKVGGCGMDMGFDLVYRLGYSLWPDGTPAPHGTRNGKPDTDGGYALKQVFIRDADFRVVRTSRNLRGILEYSRQHRVERLDLYRHKKDTGGTLGIAWADGATCITDFASYSVMTQWVANRRAFKGVQPAEHGQ